MGIIFLEPPVEASPYCWMFTLGQNKLGVHRYNGWCWASDERTVFFDSESKCILLFPLLELDASVFFNFLGKVQLEFPAYAESISQFPKSMLLRHAFHTSVSDYWLEKALAWLELDHWIQPSFKEELEKFVGNKTIRQDMRHRAKKILRATRPALA